jgi:predicted MFS family arabinose efflux permease
VATVAFVLTGLAVYMDHYWLLLVSRIIAGLFSGNLAIAQAGVASLSPPHLRTRFSAVFGGLGSFGWVIGGVIAVAFSHPSINQRWGLSLPAFSIAFLFLLCLCSIWLIYPHEKLDHSSRPESFGKLFANLIKPFRTPVIQHLLVIYGINLLGWMMYQGYLSAYLIEKFDFTFGQEAMVYLASAIWFFIGALLVAFVLLRFISPQLLIRFPIIIAALGVLSFTFIGQSHNIWWAVAIASLGEVIGLACISSLLAHLAPAQMRGRVFGSWNFNLAASTAIGPLAAGYLASVYLELPYILAASLLAASWLYAVIFMWRTKIRI